MPEERTSVDSPEVSAGQDLSQRILDLWYESLGPDADISQGFIENGGDSFKAVLLAHQLFELTGEEIDYLDILEAPDAAALQGAVRAVRHG
ncbi:phosphopantetheine-binding protein [Streptomyces sp. NBC_01236]|uniref:phosphopantetheine-binding protein n=1 Tax=Streptomyces sp. NBC_01236 TaxID=2903789 RepID=UPI002E11B630|nr:hypothetical protein OG324_38530 [Streptomyces sp. NBC_01236]